MAATDVAPAMVGRNGWISDFIKADVPTLHTVFFVSYTEHLVVKKLSGELDGALRACIKSITARPLNS